MRYKILNVVLLILLISGSGFLLYPQLTYKPLSKTAELNLKTSYLMYDSNQTCQEQQAEGLLYHVSTTHFEVFRVLIFSTEIHQQLKQDLIAFRILLNQIQLSHDWDIQMSKQSDGYEIEVQARFKNKWFYETRQIKVSEYFNLVLPLIGNMTLKDSEGFEELTGLYALIVGLNGESKTVSYEHPLEFVISLKKFENQLVLSPFNMKFFFTGFDYDTFMTMNPTIIGIYVLKSHE